MVCMLPPNAMPECLQDSMRKKERTKTVELPVLKIHDACSYPKTFIHLRQKEMKIN